MTLIRPVQLFASTTHTPVVPIDMVEVRLRPPRPVHVVQHPPAGPEQLGPGGDAAFAFCPCPGVHDSPFGL